MLSFAMLALSLKMMEEAYFAAWDPRIEDLVAQIERTESHIVEYEKAVEVPEAYPAYRLLQTKLGELESDLIELQAMLLQREIEAQQALPRVMRPRG